MRRPWSPATDGLRWNDDPGAFQAWCEGRTGFPIVDAGMRQLARCGWMHNRARMIAASFLGSIGRVHVRLDDDTLLLAQVPSADIGRFAHGDPVRVIVKPVPVLAIKT